MEEGNSPPKCQAKNNDDLLTLDDISCGSSCSTITSDDEKTFCPWKYTKLREKKKTEHKRKKLLERRCVLTEFNAAKVNKMGESESSSSDEVHLSDNDVGKECESRTKPSDAKKASKQKKNQKSRVAKENRKWKEAARKIFIT